MTIQEYYDNFTDEDLAKALSYMVFFKAVKLGHAKISGESVGLLDGVVQSRLEKQATKRWLQNQTK